MESVPRAWNVSCVRNGTPRARPNPLPCFDVADKVDLKPFQRGSFTANLGLGRGSTISGALSAMEAHVSKLVSRNADPRSASWREIQAMGCHPMVYLAERTVTGIIRRPDLYTVEHPDEKVKAETEEWLWPLMRKGLLDAAARAFSYGNVPVTFNWEKGTLRYRIKDRNRSAARTVFTKSYDMLPYPLTAIVRDGDEAVEFTDYETNEKYSGSRIHHFVWDPEFGDLRGQGARYRAYCDYATSLVLELLQSNYLERSVDPPRVAYAPAGKLDDKDDGEDAMTVADYVASLLQALRGGGAAVFPSQFDENGNKLYDLDVLDLPDRDQVWLRSLGRLDNRILLAYLASPTLAGVEDMAAAASRSLEGMLKEFVQDLADWVATNLTEIVAKVYAVNYTDDMPPEIRATDVGKAGAKKMLLEVLRIASDETSRYVDVAKGLDKLGIDVLDTPIPVPEPADGRTRDMSSDREERRERGQTEEAEDATGEGDETGG